MNVHIRNQCNNMITSVEIFKQGCKMAAEQDDDSISKEEKKLLDKLNKASDQFIKDIQKLMN